MRLCPVVAAVVLAASPALAGTINYADLPSSAITQSYATGTEASTYGLPNPLVLERSSLLDITDGRRREIARYSYVSEVETETSYDYGLLLVDLVYDDGVFQSAIGRLETASLDYVSGSEQYGELTGPVESISGDGFVFGGGLAVFTSSAVPTPAALGAAVPFLGLLLTRRPSRRS